MEINLKYGNGIVNLSLPERADAFKSDELISQFDPENFYREFLQKIINRNLHAKKVAIVVADKSRRCNYPVLLPLIVKALRKTEVKNKDIRFFIAYGTHASQTESESLATYGDVFREYRFVHHSTNETTRYKDLGRTNRGTLIEIREDIFEHDLIVTIGAISFHYFAGFGGGRKLLFPGLASKNAILNNHRLFLDTQSKQLHAACRPGNLEDNPIAEDLKEIAGMLPKHIEIHGLMNENGALIDTLIGEEYVDFEKACIIHKKNFRVNDNKKYDVVIASAGGFPKDINFIQAHKAIHHASLFAKEGGKIIVLAECCDGIGSESFLEHFRHEYKDAFDEINSNYTGNGGTALSLMEKSRKFKIFLLTSLEEKHCLQTGIKKLATASAIADHFTNTSESVLIMQNPTGYIPV